MRLYLGKKRKPPVSADKQHHVKVSQRGFERLEACLKASPVKSRRLMLDNLILSYSQQLGVEPMLEKRWREAGKRKKASKARLAHRKDLVERKARRAVGMGEIEQVWCVKESRGPWHGTSTGHARPESDTVIHSLCRQDVFREWPGVPQQHRQPDCEKCLDILRRRAKRQAGIEDSEKQRVLFET